MTILDHVTSEQLDAAVRIALGKEFNRERLSREMGGSAEVVEFIQMMLVSTRLPSRAESVIATALTIGVEMGVALASKETAA